MARRGKQVDDPDEATLVTGSAKFQRHLVYTNWFGRPVAQLCAAGLLILAALLAHSMPLAGLAAVLVAIDIWLLRRSRTRQANLIQAERLNGPAANSSHAIGE